MPHSNHNAEDPLAFFLTWTTYGTWLPGDDRGWNKKNIGETQKPDPTLEDAARKSMTEPEFTLSDEHRTIVEATIRKHCQIRHWHPHVVNPRTNHVHVVATAPGYSPDIVMDQFKAWCTRELKEAGCERKNFWSERGSRRSVNDEKSLEQVIFYASEGQDRKNRDQQ